MLHLTIGTAVASAVMAGVFFSFSSFIMTALGNIQPTEGIRAMQRINIDVFCWSFFLLFFGLPIASLGLGIYAVMKWPEPQAIYHLLGSIVYLTGSFIVTIAGNVPLNNALARIDPKVDDAAIEWHKYLVLWTRWNHVRTAACLVACLVFTTGSIVEWV